MRVFKIADMDMYIELVRLTGERFAENYIGDEIPMFTCVQTLEDNLGLDFSDLYDDDGEPKFPTPNDDNLLRNIPQDTMERELRKRMNELELEFPMHVVVYAEYAFDRIGNTAIVIFSEVKEETIHGLKTPGNSLK